jgi:sugar O-acyltransferase (sialic acid O-acetyltransferase NeuD family)
VTTARVVLYGVGSPLVVDAEEACRRAGLVIAAGVRNVPGDAHVSADVPLVSPETLDDALRALPFVVALFTPGHRKACADDALRHGFARCAVLVDPSSAVARSAALDEGVFVNAGCVVGGAARLGRFVLVNRSASIGHHAVLDDYCSIGPGAVLCGQVRVGRGAMIGAGSTVLPDVAIGANAIIGAGSLVREDVPAHARVEGRPARLVRAGIAGYRDLSV